MPWPSNSPPEGSAVLIAAQSGRALAAAARRAGLRPYVADLFGDEDARALAEGYRGVAGRFGGSLDGTRVLDALDALAAQARGGVLGVVLGSGFEGAPGLMRAIAARHRLIGASPDAVAALKDPLAFAGHLAAVGAPHPQVSLGPVPDPEDWLAKRRGGSGGGHVRPAREGPPPRSLYHQRRVSGERRSVAFLADGRGVRTVGVTEQWAAASGPAPFRYAGAMEPGSLPGAVMGEIVRALEGLVARTGLRGLASADCLVDGDAWWLLEVNPRPGATLDVLDRRPTPLLLRHVEASLGSLSAPEPPPIEAAASLIVYADAAIASVPPVGWPDWVSDRPSPGTPVPAGAPLCTVHARAEAPDALKSLIDGRAALVRALLRSEAHERLHPPSEPQRPGRAPRGSPGP